MEIAAGILAAIIFMVIGYKIGYSFCKRNVLTHLIQQKMITSEQYTELDEEDI